ncbi:MAG: ParA family protein [Desulfobacteraceae bacterium]|nr:ParA family protein [Desulfobacteraceae bacterium]
MKIYTLHSQKGGVGKTSIALAIACLSAFKENKKTLIIDADMTGTSLIDIDNFETISSNKKSFFNDLILATPPDFKKYTSLFLSKSKQQKERFIKRFCWEVPEGENKLYYMPANPHSKNIRNIVPLLSQEDHLGFFKSRLEDILSVATFADFKYSANGWKAPAHCEQKHCMT